MVGTLSRLNLGGLTIVSSVGTHSPRGRDGAASGHQIILKFSELRPWDQGELGKSQSVKQKDPRRLRPYLHSLGHRPAQSPVDYQKGDQTPVPFPVRVGKGHSISDKHRHMLR